MADLNLGVMGILDRADPSLRIQEKTSLKLNFDLNNIPLFWKTDFSKIDFI